MAQNTAHVRITLKVTNAAGLVRLAAARRLLDRHRLERRHSPLPASSADKLLDRVRQLLAGIHFTPQLEPNDQ